MKKQKAGEKSATYASVNQPDGLTLSVDAFGDQASTSEKRTVGERMKAAREALKLSRPEFVTKFGGSVRTLENNEAGDNEARAGLIEAFVRAGINANWLLAEQGPMMWADTLEKARTRRSVALLDDAQWQIAKHALGRVDRRWFITATSDDGHALNAVVEDYNNGAIFPNGPVRKAVPALTIDDLADWGRTAITWHGRIAENDPHGYAAIPLYNGICAAAGHGAVVEHEAPDDALMFKEDWIRFELGARPQDLCLIRVSGDSMEPTLRAGDVILVDRSASRPNREGIYIIRMGEMLLVKRVQAMPGGKLRVTSDNSAFESWQLDVAAVGSDIVIVGRVVWSGRRL